MTGLEASNFIKTKLQQAGLYNQNELNSLFFDATGKERAECLFTALTAEDEAAVCKVVERRLSGEPLQYICGSWPFLDFEVKVDSRALIPRPETELLAETAFKLCPSSDGLILDLCSGSGVLAISLKRAFPSAKVRAVELSQEAHELICENVKLHNLDISAVLADVFFYHTSLDDCSVSLIVCNPPYVTLEDYRSNYSELKYEPSMAFLADDNGLEFYSGIIPNYFSKLMHGGVLAFEIGEEQGEAVKELFKKFGYIDITVYKDDAALDRVVCAKRP